MANKVSLSLKVFTKTRKMLKQLALVQDKTMTATIEEVIESKWREINEGIDPKKTS